MQDFKSRTYASLAGVFRNKNMKGERDFDLPHDPLVDALTRVCERLKIKAQFPPDWPLLSGQEEKLEAFADSTSCAFREVELNSDWYRNDFGILLWFDKEGEIYLTEKGRGNQPRVWNAGKKETEFWSVHEIEEKAELCLMFFPRFGSEALRFSGLVKRVLKNRGKEYLGIGLVSALAGLISILFPVGVGLLFGQVIPSANQNLLLQLALVLLVVAFSGGLFQLGKNLLSARLQGWVDWDLQTSLMDRILRLPLQELNKENAGTLARKVFSFRQILRFISSGIADLGFSFLYILFNLFSLFFFSPELAWLVMGAGLLYALFLAYTVRQEISLHREIKRRNIWLDAMVIQFMKGLNKIKQAAAEWQIMAFWSHHFSGILSLERQSGRHRLYMGLLNANLVWLVQAVLFVVFLFRYSDLGSGAFLGLNAAFLNVFLALGTLSGGIRQLRELVPVYSELKPFLETPTEHYDSGKLKLGLTGRIEVERLHFRYYPDGPLILDDFSLTVEPGESVALVGPSGSGKSTLLRLLLGFDKAESGDVLYDGQSMDTLHLRHLRQQFGVVLQNDQLLAGSIYENIAGTKNLSMDLAWEAAGKASIREEIEAMPMQMHTLISDHASTLSGGQKQRLLIARALAGNPALLFFDEATSALDNVSQKHVSDTLDQLSITRIVIAHRLSTIKGMDKIVYMENGKVRECGTYEALMEKNGLFKKLAERQMAESV